MKTKSKNAKLILNKETIAQLKEKQIVGGAAPKTRTYCPGGCTWTLYC